MNKLIACLMLVLPMIIGNSFAQQPAVMVSKKAGWHKIGSLTANFKLEKDEIAVMGADKFKAIRLKVTDAPIHIANLEVYYESGEKEDVAVSSDLNKGAETKIFNLKNADKPLKKVVLIYKTVANQKNEKATVELYGLK
jgi:hypothetical protein